MNKHTTGLTPADYKARFDQPQYAKDCVAREEYRAFLKDLRHLRSIYAGWAGYALEACDEAICGVEAAIEGLEPVERPYEEGER